MTDRPIIFSAPMIRALLEGRKSQTRRVLKPQPSNNFAWPIGISDGAWGYMRRTGLASNDLTDEWVRLPFAPGDKLWVRETWAIEGAGRLVPVSTCHKPRVQYPATDDPPRYAGERYWWNKRSPIHMPRWASRLTLLVTDVRVQRVQDISEEDAIAEGITVHFGGDPARYEGVRNTRHSDPTMAFRDLWNSIHGHDAWASNQWVVALTFETHRCNIDEMREAAA